MHKCIIVAPPALRFARVSSFISLRVTPPAPSNPAKLISSSISAFHYRVHSHGTRERASEREKLQEAISPSHFQPSIISCIDESSPFFRLSFFFFFFLSFAPKIENREIQRSYARTRDDALILLIKCRRRIRWEGKLCRPVDEYSEAWMDGCIDGSSFRIFSGRVARLVSLLRIYP